MQGKESFVQQEPCEADSENDPGKKSEDGNHHQNGDCAYEQKQV